MFKSIHAIIISSLLTLFGCVNKLDVKPLVDILITNDWKFKQVDSVNWLSATVPGCVHTDLLANHKINDPFYRTNEKSLQWIDKKDWEYKTTFVVGHQTFMRNKIELYFEGLDTYADVYLNDSLLLKADNMFREWTVNIKNKVREGNNTLHILFHSPITIGLQKLNSLGYDLPAANDQSENGGLGDKKVSVFTRKAGYHYGWDWGPRFVTSGIWRPVHLIAWNNARINNIQYIQKNISKDHATIIAVYEIESAIHNKANISLSCEQDAAISVHQWIHLKPGINKVSVTLNISRPVLWWTNGLGKAFLYHLTSTLFIKDEPIDIKKTNIGIRTLKIVQAPDSLGKSFYVELNGVPVFMKGANYIPNDNFLNRVTPQIYEKVVKSAADTHMNMLRVWGGGIYEDDYFYSLADKYGILLWHDLMFACSMYPGDHEFLENVRQEVIQNVKRIRNHPSIALWCGNNEIDVAWQQNNENAGFGWKEKYTPKQRQAIWHSYDTLFHKIIPEIFHEMDSDRFYWPSSPLSDWYKQSDFKTHSGDIHYWDVWWGQKPFDEYKTHIGRFMTEYGFQSFPEFNSVKMYTQPEDWDIFSEVMKAHQRSSIGNGTIKNYMQRDYKVPSDFRKFLYVGQVLQAEGIKIAMEAHRRKMPYCMGSLFWQINDCWPVASWSSTDYYRKWKAQQYFAKKAFDQILVSPVLSHDTIYVSVVNDALNTRNAILEIKIIDFSGSLLMEKKLPIAVKANSSGVYFTMELKNILSERAYKNALLSVCLYDENKVIAKNILYFIPVKDLSLPKANIKKSIHEENGCMIITCTADKLVKNLYLSLTTGKGFFSDNYFDILPGETIVIQYQPEGDLPSSDAFSKNLNMMQMADI